MTTTRIGTRAVTRVMTMANDRDRVRYNLGDDYDKERGCHKGDETNYDNNMDRDTWVIIMATTMTITRI